MSPIFFEIGILNMACKCVLGWWSVTYHFRVNVTLTSGLVFRIIVSVARGQKYLNMALVLQDE